ncbi:unnamed protein product [Arabidopsis halleri]
MAYYDCPDRILGFVILSASVEGKFSEADLLGAMIIYLSTLKTESCVSPAALTKLALNKGKAAMVSIQRMDSLVTNMPKIWKLEDKVVGADAGKGTFQFNFRSEEDLQGVFAECSIPFRWMDGCFGSMGTHYLQYLSLCYQLLGQSLWNPNASLGRSDFGGCGEKGGVN